ncbi:hypothetical protein LINGRAHAP2_LOCUS5328 [Linum grandiflorum]
METVDNPKMEQETMSTTQKISVVDHINGFQYSPERSSPSDNFVIDMMEDLSHNKDSYPSSRITLQRSLSRKGLIRGSEKKAVVESVVAASACSSPRSGAALVGSSSTPEKGIAAVGQGNHQITITSVAGGNIKATAAAGSEQGRCTPRRNSFKRCQASWLLDPRKVVIFFATLSSMGTLLLIYFTLSIGKVQSEAAAAAME